MFKQLRHFQSVVRLNSFSAAAEENYISQSAISRQVQALERELGFQFLERKNRLFALTEAGAYFYQKSLVLTADCERMCAEAAKIAHGDGASLTIGFLRSYAGEEFHGALEDFPRGTRMWRCRWNTAITRSCTSCCARGRRIWCSTISGACFRTNTSTSS